MQRGAAVVPWSWAHRGKSYGNWGLFWTGKMWKKRPFILGYTGKLWKKCGKTMEKCGKNVKKGWKIWKNMEKTMENLGINGVNSANDVENPWGKPVRKRIFWNGGVPHRTVDVYRKRSCGFLSTPGHSTGCAFQELTKHQGYPSRIKHGNG